MALTNAEKQKRWREKRNRLAAALIGTPKEIADGVLQELGPKQAKKVVRALDARLRNLKPNCRVCHGTGFAKVQLFTACGEKLLQDVMVIACSCSPADAEHADRCRDRGRQSAGYSI
jgi:hypothetical protein